MVDTYDRSYGMYEMSMPTSLAFEGLTHTGEYEARGSFGPPPVLQYEAVYINIKTLIRNAIRAYSTSDALFLKPKVIYEAVKEDLNVIMDLMDDQKNQPKVVPYICRYTSLESKYPNAKLKTMSSAKDIFFGNIDIEVTKLIENSDLDIVNFTNELKGIDKCVILTHVPLDIMSYSNFPKLDLLESHTGTVKGRDRWFTKLSKYGRDNNMPFIMPMLQIFGDDVTFAPQPISFRRKLVAVGEKRGWNGLTAREKVLGDIRLENDRELLDQYTDYI